MDIAAPISLLQLHIVLILLLLRPPAKTAHAQAQNKAYPAAHVEVLMPFMRIRNSSGLGETIYASLGEMV